MSYFVRVIEGTNSPKTVYSKDMSVAAFNPTLYGEVDPVFYTFDDGTLTPIPDDKILENAKAGAIIKLNKKRSDRLNAFMTPVVPSVMVMGSYTYNLDCAEAILTGRGNEIFLQVPIVMTYIEYLQPKAEASGFPDVIQFAQYLHGQKCYIAFLGGQVEEQYYQRSTDIGGIRILTTLDDALNAINRIVEEW
jgi:hypothetical protein